VSYTERLNPPDEAQALRQQVTHGQRNLVVRFR
jgi:hypothetical protein